ncbi:hypothetical protein B0H11DRAFT_1960080 [Mycena galericulata]|nr:hypothetical protein B0H11DRAFT_1960080 [Mycena galericulata]
MDNLPPGDTFSSAQIETVAPNDEPGQRLPPELIQLAIEYLRCEPETLKRTSLVSRQWLPISRTYLFEHICLSAPRTDRPRTDCSVLYEVLSESPHIALYIRHVTVLAGGMWSTKLPLTLRWISSDETLPALLDILSKAEPARVRSLHMRLSGERWTELPEALQTSIRSLINSPSMRDVDLTGVDVVDPTVFQHCPNLRKVKLSEIDILRTADGDLSAEAGPWSATCESLTILDTVNVPSMLSWAITVPTFRALRELRLGFRPLDGVPYVEDFLRHSRDTLEALHLQPVYARWPIPADFIDISGLHALTSLRISLGLSVDSDPFPWVIFLLSNLGPNCIQHLTIDLRISDDSDNTRRSVLALPWLDLDSAITQPHLAGLSTLEITCFAYEQHHPFHASTGTTEWLRQSVTHFLPRSQARDVFEAYELKFPQSRFFYWPGPLNWSNSL